MRAGRRGRRPHAGAGRGLALSLTCCGAAGEVTGSCYLIEAGASRFLVDCGMFQGPHDVAARNREPWPFDPSAIDFVVLTHAHVDHSGLLPRLAREGFRGPVYATPATRDLIDVMLRDSAHLQEADAQRAARHGGRAGRAGAERAEPLYRLADVEGLLRQVVPLPYDLMRGAAPAVRVRLRDAGHILGSASAELWLRDGSRGLKAVVSGDLGEPGRPIQRDPVRIGSADLLLVESTYGDRDHKPLGPTLAELVTTVTRTLHDKHGNLLVPAFAVGRTQELLYWFERLTLDGRLADLNVWLDSPLASEVTAITARHFELLDEEARRLLAELRHAGGHARLRLRLTRSVAESMALNRVDGGAVIIAASGMCDGGRIRHHLRHHLPSPRTTVLITGYQAEGTLGRRLVDRATVVSIFGEEVPVRAEIVTLGGFSAHAGQSALLAWLRGFAAPPRRVLLVHGEARATAPFAARIATELGWTARVPERGARMDLAEIAHDDDAIDPGRDDGSARGSPRQR